MIRDHLVNRMTRAESLDTKDRLVQAAAILMWERGFQATNVEEICQRANMTKGGFYYFFSSKTDLAIAAIEASWAHTKAAIFDSTCSSGDRGLGRISKLIDSLAFFQTEAAAEKEGFLGCPFGNLGQEMARHDERIREAIQNIFDAHCDLIERALVFAEQIGEIPVGDNRQRAQNVLALLEGAFLLAKVADDPQIFRNTTTAILAVSAA